MEAQSGSTSNAAAVFNGNVGIGDSNPDTLLSIGSNGRFQVDSDGDVTLVSGAVLDLSATLGGAGDGLLLPQTTNCSAMTTQGQLCWDSNDATLWVGNGTTATQINSTGIGGAEFVLPHDERVFIDGATTANDQTGGILEIDGRSAFNDFSSLDVTTENTSTDGISLYGINNTVTATGAVTGSAASSTFGIRNTTQKTGADTNNGTYNLFGISSFASQTGATNTGTKVTTAGIFSATGDTAGDSTAIGLQASADGADNSYAAIFSQGNVGIGDTTPQALLTVGGSDNFTIDGSGNTALASMANLRVLNGAICVDNDGDCSSLVAGEIRADAFPTTGGDVAEMYHSEETLEPGDVVAVVGNDRIGKSVAPYATTLLGVVSTEPGVILRSGEMFNDETQTRKPNTYAVGLVGRVPVKISLENGPIEVGDHLTSSSTPGVAMKATTPGRSIGVALESFHGSSDENPKIFCFASLGERNVAAAVDGLQKENTALKIAVQQLREEFEQLRVELREGGQ